MQTGPEEKGAFCFFNSQYPLFKPFHEDFATYHRRFDFSKDKDVEASDRLVEVWLGEEDIEHIRNAPLK